MGGIHRIPPVKFVKDPLCKCQSQVSDSRVYKQFHPLPVVSLRMIAYSFCPLDRESARHMCLGLLHERINASSFLPGL